ncbi:MAG: trypsin-like peptidase domain-containing protein [Clostridia bacterium]|nr:trypsin-like peptidase domain-containing protein [Clostridia bacterium]
MDGFNAFKNENTSYENENLNQGSQDEVKWFTDDFEQAAKNRVPDSHALSIYRPKEKGKFKKFLKRPAVTAIVSSVLTCAICMSAFAIAFKPQTVERPYFVTENGASADTTLVASTQNLEQATGSVLTVPEIYDKTALAVVSIVCQSSASSAYVQGATATSSGSGIVITEDGYIATNNHVIEGASVITVRTLAGQTFDAKVIGSDSRTDLAVLKVEPEDKLIFAELGDSSELKVGELAVAIGNPLREELAGTLTVGVISAINRNMVIDGKQMTMLQTDAAINPGNSGGALLNSKGQVIGINTAKSYGEEIEGLGFAIPINEAKPIINSLIKDGYVTGRPLIGIVGIDVTEEIAKVNDLVVGVYVRDVSQFSAAERAGIKVGDVITSFDGKKVLSIDELNKFRDEHKAGDTVKVELNRSGQKLTVDLTLLEEKPQAESTQQQQQQQPQQQIPRQITPSDLFKWFGW